MPARSRGARKVAWTGGLLSAGLLGLVGLVAAIAPESWARLFTTSPAVIASAGSYFAWAGPCYALFGLGLCLYFSSQGAGKVLGPVIAGTVRLLIVIGGGAWLASVGAPAWQLFALIGFAMLAYGAATAYAVWAVPWGTPSAAKVRS